MLTLRLAASVADVEKGLYATKLAFFSKYFSCLVSCFLSQYTLSWFCDWGGLWTKCCCCRVHQYIAGCVPFRLMGLNGDAAFLSTVPPVISLLCSLSPGRRALIYVTLKNCIALFFCFYYYYCSYYCLFIGLFICGLFFICPWFENTVGCMLIFNFCRLIWYG